MVYKGSYLRISLLFYGPEAYEPEVPEELVVYPPEELPVDGLLVDYPVEVPVGDYDCYVC